MDLTIKGIVHRLTEVDGDVMFLLTNETADEVVNELLDKEIKFGDDLEKQTEYKIMEVLDEEEVVMISKFDNYFYVECAYGYDHLKEYDNFGEPWFVLVEENLLLEELLSIKEVNERLGNANLITTFGTYLVLPNECECCNCDKECEDRHCTCDELEDEDESDYQEFAGIMDEIIEDAFNRGYEEGIQEVVAPEWVTDCDEYINSEIAFHSIANGVKILSSVGMKVDDALYQSKDIVENIMNK